MFVSGPYVRRNSFSIREVVNHTVSHIMGLHKQLSLDTNTSKMATWSFYALWVTHILSRCADICVLLFVVWNRRNLLENYTAVAKCEIFQKLFQMFLMFTKTGLPSISCNSNWMHWGIQQGWGRPSIQANRSAYCFYGTCPPRLITPRSALAKHAWIAEITILIQD